MNSLAQSLIASPELFPYSLDVPGDRVGFIRLNEGQYRAASFLDQRISQAPDRSAAVPVAELLAAVEGAGLPETCHFIFHIGHVGSTLVSRLIGEFPGTFSLREPLILRTLAQIQAEAAQAPGIWRGESFDRRTGAFLKLWSRTFRPEDRTIIKATSFVSEFAAALLARASKPRALLMFVRPERYLATIMGGENAPLEARALAPSRWQRLRKRLGGDFGRLEQLSLGEVVAMSWAAEMTALVAGHRQAAERTMFIDFDAFLSNPDIILLHALRHLHVTALSEHVTSVVTGPHMRRYSKAPEHAYDAGLRQAVLDQAMATSGDEIKRGRAWLDRLAGTNSVVAEAISVAEQR
jgi:hypothetical protein